MRPGKAFEDAVAAEELLGCWLELKGLLVEPVVDDKLLDPAERGMCIGFCADEPVEVDVDVIAGLGRGEELDEVLAGEPPWIENSAPK